MNQPKEQVEVPEAAVEILAAELYEVYVANPAPDGWAGENDGAKGVWREESRQYLTAALPAIEQAVEERVRERVEAVEAAAASATFALETAADELYAADWNMGASGAAAEEAARNLEAALSQPHNTEEEK